MALPVTRYAKSSDVHIAYQVFGGGPIDLVFVPGFISHVENYWDHPDLARWLLRLGSFARVIMFDKRGTGLSDPVSGVPSLEQRMDDVRAVTDAVGIERAALLGVSEGGALATLFGATYPERCKALVLYGAFARSPASPEALKAFFKYADQAWGSGLSLPAWAPSRRNDPALQQWWGRFERLGASPAAAMAVMQMAVETDISDVLSSVHVPTLVIHCTDDTLIDVECGRFLAHASPERGSSSCQDKIIYFSSTSGSAMRSKISSLDRSPRWRATGSSRRSCSPTLSARPRAPNRLATSAGAVCSTFITPPCGG